MPNTSRYHPALVTLHWLLAALIVAALAVGFFLAEFVPDADPRKIGMLRLHMAGGVSILALMIVRFVIRVRTSRLPAATTGNRLLDRLAPMMHYGFYVLVLLMTGTGLATAVVSGLSLIVFGNSGAPLPPDLTVYPSFVGHVVLAILLTAFIVLHVLAALYQQFVKRDGLLGRMSFGKRTTVPGTGTT
jgi:cytochrome b561